MTSRQDEVAGAAVAGPRGSGGRRLFEGYDTALLDLDGVVYTGPVAVPHAREALAEARDGGMRLAYVTNNAARPPAAVAGHLSELGIPTGAEDVVNSAQAAARLAAERVPAGAPVLVVGGAGLVEALEEMGLRPVRSAEDSPAAVVQGFAPDVDWGQLAEAAYAVQRGVPWIASNADLTIPRERGIAPGNGALVQAVRIATGAEPVVAGKPEVPMHRESILRTGAERPLVVGDRLDTDIEGAVNGGVDSLLVFTGVASPAQVLAAGPGERPTYLAADLRGLLVPHPEVERAGDGAARCGGWSASVVDGELRVVRPEGADAAAGGAAGPSWDGLRAACAAAWDAADAAGGTAPDSRKALAALGF